MRFLSTVPLLLRHGLYRYSFLSEERAGQWFEQGSFISAIRRPEVATVLTARFGRPITLKTERIQNTIETGEDHLIAAVTSEAPLTLRFGSLTRVSGNMTKAEAFAKAALTEARATRVPRRTLLEGNVLHSYGYYVYRCATALDAASWLDEAYVSGHPSKEAIAALARLTAREVSACQPCDTELHRQVEQHALQDPGDQVLVYHLRLPPLARPAVYQEASSLPFQLDDRYIHINSQLGTITRLDEHALPTSFL